MNWTNGVFVASRHVFLSTGFDGELTSKLAQLSRRSSWTTFQTSDGLRVWDGSKPATAGGN